MNVFRLLGLVALAAMLSGPALATTYDAVTGFDASNNPSLSGVWSYRANDASQTLLTDPSTASGSATLPEWSNQNTQPLYSQSWVVDDNTNSVVSNSCCGSIQYQPKALSLDGQTVGSIVRFTAPAAGTYSVTGLFESDDTNMTTHDVGVIANIGGTNSALLAATSLVNGTQVTFSNVPVTLGVGDYVDFISYGFSGGSYGNTGLQATLTTASAPTASVPEPASLALLVVGLIGLIGIEQRYRRA